MIGAGTAVTFDAVDASGRHLGGLIFAGARLVAAALDRSTSDIGATSLAGAPPSGLGLLGKNTDNAVGHAAMLECRSRARPRRRTGRYALHATPRVLVTGGDGPHLQAWLETETQLAADLVLEGLALFAGEPRAKVIADAQHFSRARTGESRVCGLACLVRVAAPRRFRHRPPKLPASRL